MFKFSSSKIKTSSKTSSNASSRRMQDLADYHLKENGPFMTAEALLKTEEEERNENEEFTGLQKTDIIQFRTENFHHWGLYIGNNCIAHLENGFIRQAEVVKVANGFQCRINNKVKSSEKRGLKHLPPQKIMETIHSQLNKPCLHEHSASRFNSEHLVTLWKYGEGWSDTVHELAKDVGRIAGVGVAATAGVSLCGLGGLAAAPAGYEIGGKLGEGISHILRIKD